MAVSEAQIRNLLRTMPLTQVKRRERLAALDAAIPSAKGEERAMLQARADLLKAQMQYAAERIAYYQQELAKLGAEGNGHEDGVTFKSYTGATIAQTAILVGGCRRCGGAVGRCCYPSPRHCLMCGRNGH
jgi:hypothetical protein